MDLIQNALDRSVSGAHLKIFFVAFGPFKNFLSTSEPKKLIEICVNLQNISQHFSSFGVWFSKTRQKCLSAVAKSFLRVV